MNTPDERWWSVRAGEYVLGTLRGDDLVLFERILSHDSGMQAEVGRWEQRLSGLNETARDHQPGEHVWPLIIERIRNGKAEASGIAPDAADATLDVPVRQTTVPDATREAANSPRWRAIAGLATAASVVLGLLVGVLLSQRADMSDAPPLRVDGLAVVLSDENGTPYFLVETDYGNLRVRVTALTPPAIDEDRNFQLWQALPDRSSVRPVALLPEESGRSKVFDVGSLIQGSDLFGVSIESVDAPTDGGPVGPVVAHGDYLESREDD